jgi:hypothetical protein
MRTKIQQLSMKIVLLSGKYRLLRLADQWDRNAGLSGGSKVSINLELVIIPSFLGF